MRVGENEGREVFGAIRPEMMRYFKRSAGMVLDLDFDDLSADRREAWIMIGKYLRAKKKVWEEKCRT